MEIIQQPSRDFHVSWRAKLRVPLERASKTILETGVKSDVAFCLGSSVEKTNSEGVAGMARREGLVKNDICHFANKMREVCAIKKG